MKSKDRSACVVRAACSTARHGMHTFHLLGDHLAMPVAVHAQCTHHGGGLRGEQRLSQGEGNKARFGACARGHALAPTERHVTVHRNVKHASVSIAQGKRASARALNMLVILLVTLAFSIELSNSQSVQARLQQQRRSRQWTPTSARPPEERHGRRLTVNGSSQAFLTHRAALCTASHHVLNAFCEHALRQVHARAQVPTCRSSSANGEHALSRHTPRCELAFPECKRPRTTYSDARCCFRP